MINSESLEDLGREISWWQNFCIVAGYDDVQSIPDCVYAEAANLLSVGSLPEIAATSLGAKIADRGRREGLG